MKKENKHVAVILAAGRGTRFEIDINKPKAFIEILGKSLIDLSIDALTQKGISVDQITIVTGHKHEVFRNYKNNKFDNIQLTFNPNYNKGGSGNSLRLGLEHAICSGASFITILESDILYSKNIINDLHSLKTSSIVVSNNTNAGDEVYVTTNSDGVVTKLSKNGKTEFEFIGISTLTRNDAKKIIEKLNSIDVIVDEYEQILMSSGVTFKKFLIKPYNKWCEIDTITQYYNAVNNIILDL